MKRTPFRGAPLFVALLLGACSSSSDSALNFPPSADAGPDRTVNENTRVQLAGQASDLDDLVTIASWSQISGPSVAIDSPNSLAATFLAPQVAIGFTETIVLRLTVTDGRGAAAIDDVTISVDSADFVVFVANKDDLAATELYKYDTQSDTVTKLSGTLVAGRAVNFFAVSPNGRYVAYVADQDTDNVFELYVAMADGSATGSRVSGALVANGNVGQFTWAPDSSRIAYLADQDTDGVQELYTVNADGTSNVKVNGTLVAAGAVLQFAWAPDGSRLAYLADQDTNDVNELYTALPDGSGNVKVSGTLVTGGDVAFNILWAPDGSRVAYIADQDTDNVNELYGVLPDGTGNTKLNGTLVAGGGVFNAAWAPDASRIAYQADQDTNDQTELYSSLPDGTGNVKLNPLFADPNGDVFDFRWAPNSSRIAYRAIGQDAPGVIEAYTSFPASAVGNAKVNGALVASGSVASLPEWSPDSSHLVYVADQDTQAVVEVYVSAADGTGNVKVSGTMVTNGDAFVGTGNQLWSPDSSLLIYVADQVTDGVLEHFATNLDGSVNNQITRTPVGSLQFFARWSADGSRAVYPSQQDTVGQTELYMSTPDGITNVKISGPLVAGGSVGTSFQWSP